MIEHSSAILTDGLRARTSGGLATELAQLIRTGAVPAGSKLPTIRSVAVALGVSVGTVAEVWSMLRTQGLIETRRRGGTLVTAPSVAPGFPGWSEIDFLLSSPDTALQPSLEQAFLHALRQPGVNAWGREHMVGALREAVEPTWAFPAEAFTSAGGGTEGLWLATRAVLTPGRPLAVEEPAPPGYLATLAELGADVIGVPVDDEGPTPAGLRRALDAGATAFVHQPGGPFSTRHVLSADRVAELAAELRLSDALVVEDDSLGPLSISAVRTLGAALPTRTIRVLSFCKAFGLDLRTSVLGGARPLIDRVISLRSGGVASNSRILQHALAAMIHDETAASTVAEARERYSNRRTIALRAFRSAGLIVDSGPGSLVIWVEVPDERTAAMALATRGIVVDVGAAAFAAPQPTGLLRFSIAQLPEDEALVGELAALVDRSVSGDLRVRFD